MSKLTLGLCSDWLLGGKGIMNVLTTNFNVPWKNSIDGTILDLDYYGNRSGNKVVSPLVEKLVTEEGLSDAAMLRLATLIYNKYGEGWERTALALAEEYNPIHNYDGTETSEDTETITGSRENSVTRGESTTNTGTVGVSATRQNTGTQTNAQTGTDTTTETLNNTETITHGKSISDTITHGKTNNSVEYGKKSTENKVYGFNSNSAVNSSESDETVGGNSAGQGYHNNTTEGGTTQDVNTESGTTSTAHGGTITTGLQHGLTDTRTDNLSETNNETTTNNLTQRVDGSETGSEDTTTERTLTHTMTKGGNLGVTTTQQMLTQEMDFRQIYNIFNTVVFPNVDAVMCLDIFGCEDLTLDDFTIINESSYVLPIASETVLGGIKIGEFLTIQSDGTVSVNMEHVTPSELASTLVDYAKKTDLNDYVTTALLSTTLQGYVTTSTLVTTLSNYVLNSSLQTTLLDYVTNSGLTTILADYVTSNNLATILSDYVTSSDLTLLLAQKQDTLVSGTNIKTINGVSILGEGDLVIKGGGAGISASVQSNNFTSSVSGNISMEVII